MIYLFGKAKKQWKKHNLNWILLPFYIIPLKKFIGGYDFAISTIIAIEVGR